jgi:hypothetical protein
MLAQSKAQQSRVQQCRAHSDGYSLKQPALGRSCKVHTTIAVQFVIGTEQLLPNIPNETPPPYRL